MQSASSSERLTRSTTHSPHRSSVSAWNRLPLHSDVHARTTVTHRLSIKSRRDNQHFRCPSQVEWMKLAWVILKNVPTHKKERHNQPNADIPSSTAVEVNILADHNPDASCSRCHTHMIHPTLRSTSKSNRVIYIPIFSLATHCL